MDAVPAHDLVETRDWIHGRHEQAKLIPHLARFGAIALVVALNACSSDAPPSGRATADTAGPRQTLQATWSRLLTLQAPFSRTARPHPDGWGPSGSA